PGEAGSSVPPRTPRDVLLRAPLDPRWGALCRREARPSRSGPIRRQVGEHASGPGTNHRVTNPTDRSRPTPGAALHQGANQGQPTGGSGTGAARYLTGHLGRRLASPGEERGAEIVTELRTIVVFLRRVSRPEAAASGFGGPRW